MTSPGDLLVMQHHHRNDKSDESAPQPEGQQVHTPKTPTPSWFRSPLTKEKILKNMIAVYDKAKQFPGYSDNDILIALGDLMELAANSVCDTSRASVTDSYGRLLSDHGGLLSLCCILASIQHQGWTYRSGK